MAQIESPSRSTPMDSCSRYSPRHAFPHPHVLPPHAYPHSQPQSYAPSPVFPSPSAFHHTSNPWSRQDYGLPTPLDSPLEPPFQSAFTEDIADVSESEAVAVKSDKPPPRPPNAWILYRSDRLRDIAEGVHLPDLEAIKTELGMSSDSNDKATDSEEGEGKTKTKKGKKPKKGSKPPTEGILNLGKGKTGRGIPQADISKLISMMWSREAPTVKKTYESMAERRKAEHASKYPNYKFQPQRRADKIRQREERERQRVEAKRVKDEAKSAARDSTRPKRKTRTRPPPASPYSMSRNRSNSGSGDPDIVDWNKSQFVMNPFPFTAGSLPSMQAPPHLAPQHPSHQSAPPPPHLFPGYEPHSYTHDQHMPPPHQMMYPSHFPPAEITVPGYGSAETYVFEPIPIPGDVGFSFDNLDVMPDASLDAESLAAVWCSIEEDPFPISASSGVVAAGSSNFNANAAGPSNLQMWDIPSPDAAEQWANLAPELSSSLAEQLAADWSNMYAGNEGEQPFIMVPYNEEIPSGEQDGSAPSSAHQQSNFTHNANGLSSASADGVFLSSSQPLSPIEAWSDTGRNVSFSGISRSASISAPQPFRYVSASAFPASLSVETAGWTDRSASFGAIPPPDHDPDVDDLFEDEDDYKRALKSPAPIPAPILVSTPPPAPRLPSATILVPTAGDNTPASRSPGPMNHRVSSQSGVSQSAQHPTPTAQSFDPRSPPVHTTASISGSGSGSASGYASTSTSASSNQPSPRPAARRVRVVGAAFDPSSTAPVRTGGDE